MKCVKVSNGVRPKIERVTIVSECGQFLGLLTVGQDFLHFVTDSIKKRLLKRQDKIKLTFIYINQPS